MSSPHIPSEKAISLLELLEVNCADWVYEVSHPLDAMSRGLADEPRSFVLQYQAQLAKDAPSRQAVEKAINMRFDSDAEFDDFMARLADILRRRLQ